MVPRLRVPILAFFARVGNLLYVSRDFWFEVGCVLPTKRERMEHPLKEYYQQKSEPTGERAGNMHQLGLMLARPSTTLANAFFLSCHSFDGDYA
jgi:hypothetical protein